VSLSCMSMLRRCAGASRGRGDKAHCGVSRSSLQKGVDHSKVEAVVPFKNVELKVRCDTGCLAAEKPHMTMKVAIPMSAPGADTIRLVPDVRVPAWGKLAF
jgi:hypothetical protein